MGYIKEPKGVDFVIASEPLTDKARLEISNFIRSYKTKTQIKVVKTVAKTKSSKAAHA